MERMDLMKSIGALMKHIGKMARGDAPLDNRKMANAAGKIADHGHRIPALFPKGSNQGFTEASPAIWQNPDEFKKSADSLIAAARNLAATAMTNDASALKGAYRALGKTCSGCHKQFRIKKKKKKMDHRS